MMAAAHPAANWLISSALSASIVPKATYAAMIATDKIAEAGQNGNKMSDARNKPAMPMGAICRNFGAIWCVKIVSARPRP